MYRVLIAEDSQITREQLRKLIVEELPDTEVLCASSVREVRELIDDTLETERYFDAAVLDFKLPEDRGFNPEPEMNLQYSLLKLSSRTLIIRITAFPDDTVIREFQEIARSKTFPRILPLSKEIPGWTSRVTTELKRDRIARHLDALSSPPRGTLERLDDVTFRLALLARDVVLFWKDLDDSDRELVGKYLSIESDGSEGVKVNVISGEVDHASR